MVATTATLKVVSRHRGSNREAFLGIDLTLSRTCPDAIIFHSTASNTNTIQPMQLFPLVWLMLRHYRSTSGGEFELFLALRLN